VIADGITAMEGNGPLQGTARDLGKIVLADDPVAADATCARLMGFDPLRVQHLSEGGDSSAICAPTGSRCWPNGSNRQSALLQCFPTFHYLLRGRSCDHAGELSVPRGLLRQSNGMSKSGSTQ
jgi:hypothetical protein